MTAGALEHVRNHLNKLATAVAVAAGDGELLERFLARRDEAAFEALVRRHGPLVLGVCRRVLRDHHLAEDAFQATFLVLARRAGRLCRRGALAGWLYTVAFRTALRARARAARRLRPPPTPTAGRDPLDEITGRELCALLDEELARLPEKFRLAVLLCCVEGKARDEAARQLGWTGNQVKDRLERGRECLRRRLARRGVGLPAALLAAGVVQGAASGAAGPLAGATARAAGAFAAGLPAGASARAAALAAGMPGTFVPGGKAAALLLVLVCALGGAGALAHRAQPAGEAAAPKGGPPQTAGEGKLRTDRAGDPLPEGVFSRLGTVRFRQAGNIDAVAFSSDGTVVITAGLDNTLRVWDRGTGKELGRFGAQNGVQFHAQIFCAAISPDGKRVAAGGNDLTVHVWDRATGQELFALKGTSVVQGLAWSPDGKRLASASWDKTLTLWDADTGRELHKLEGHTNQVMAVAFAPDSKTLASGAGDGTIRLWNADTGKELRKLEVSQKSVLAVAFAPGGKLLASTGGDGAVRLWESATGKEVRRVPLGDAWGRSVAFAPDGRTLAVAFGTYALHFEESRGGVVLFEVDTGKEVRRLADARLPFEAVAFAPDGKVVAAAGGHDGTLHLWDPATGRPLPDLGGHQGSVTSVEFLPDGRRVATTGVDETVRVWDAGGQQLHVFPGRFARLLQGGTLLVAGTGEGGLTGSVLDAATGQARRTFRLPAGNPYSLAVSADGRTLALEGEGHALLLWDTAAGKEIGRLEGHGKRVVGLAFSPAGGRLASGSIEDSTVRLWDLATRKELRRFTYAAHSLAFSPDGALLVAGGEDEGVRVWQAADGKELLHLPDDETHWTRACSVSFSPDGRTLATGSMNGQVRLWEAATGKLRHFLGGYEGWLAAPAFSPDGRLLAAGGSSTATLLWDLRAPGRLRAPRSAEDVRALWADLISADAERAYDAVRGLAAVPGVSVPFLGGKLSPAPPADAKQVARLIADLDSDAFATRDEAARALAKLGEAAVPALRKALAGSPSPEARRRIAALVEEWDSPLLFGELLRTQRALEVLEAAGTPEARALLRRLAGGAEGTRLTEGARAALGRLDRHAGSAP
jgi:RNA polymerase sigma factor (sigma-70 family)